MASTRSKSSSGEKPSNDGDFISLSIVKELMKAQEATMKSLFNAFVENSNKRIDNLTEKVKGAIVSLEYSQAELQDLKKETQQLAEAATKLRKEEESKSITHEKKVKEVNDKLKDLENKTDDLENRCRRNNLCFDGVREEANESWSTTENKIKEIISTKFNIQTDEFTIERAHRVGKQYTSDKPRPIVAKFNNYKVKESIMKNKKGLKGSNVYIREDFSQKVLARRKELLPKMYEERKNGNIAFLRYDKLVVYPDRRLPPRDNPTRSSQFSPSPSTGRGRGQPTWRTPSPVDAFIIGDSWDKPVICY